MGLQLLNSSTDKSLFDVKSVTIEKKKKKKKKKR